MPQCYPAFLNIAKRNCLIVGGGNIACRKAKILADCEASVEVISPKICSELKTIAQTKKIQLTVRPFQEGDEQNRFLVFAATGNSTLNQQISQLCRKKNIWLNAVDDPSYCDFYVPALLRRGDVTVAVGTSGKSPLLATNIRDEIAKILPEEIGILAKIFGNIRKYVNQSSLSYAQKKALYTSLLELGLLENLQQKQEKEVREKIKKCISSWLD